ncbi:MAG: dienelactone hydrolase family protein [Caldilineaceae bacterium]|nr:dienelactone hydrolase family protein [Caldilineaceae bacterium]
MPSYQNAFSERDSVIARCEDDRQSLMRRELEHYLVARNQQTLAQRSAWTLDYSSPTNYEASCEEHRERWSRTVGEFTFDAPYNPRLEPFLEDADMIGHWLSIDLDAGLTARAVLALPKSTTGKRPLVIAQHGISSTPERAFGLNDAKDLYHGYARALVKAGYAVLAPSNITHSGPRARLQRLCLLLGKTLAGLEVGKIRRLLSYATTLPEIDADRVGMWGISLGGMYTMFTAPLDKRIKAAIITAFFNDRWNKMAVSSPLYSSFLDADEEHIWLPGWLENGFDDSELLALICPRAVQIQQGRADSIGWWPQQHATFAKAQRYYAALGLPERADYADHHGGHEMLVAEGLAFLQQHL